jgi:hypothetical protein
MDIRSDAPYSGIVHAVAPGVVGVPHHHAMEGFHAKFSSEIVQHFGEDRAPNHPEGRRIKHGPPVRSVRGTPLEGPTVVLNVRLRKCTTVLIAHDHMLLGTNMAWSMEEAQSRSVRHGRYAFPSM